MLCQECNQQKATVLLPRLSTVSRQTCISVKMCPCKRGDLDFSFEPKFTLKNFFASFLSEPWMAKKDKEAVHPAKVQCSNCALTFAQFSQIGRFGCSNCYLSSG